jgi:uncharacterized protein
MGSTQSPVVCVPTARSASWFWAPRAVRRNAGVMWVRHDVLVAPPMWLVERGRASVVLFGDSPGARDDTWLTDAVRGAVLRSDEVWCEVPANREQIVGHPLLAEIGLSPDLALSDRLGAERTARFEAAARSLGIEPAGLQGLRPWLVAQLVEQAAWVKADISAAHAVDRVLTGLAREHGIPIRSEFSVEEVLRRFGEMPQAVELQYFDMILERAERGVAGIDHEFTAWANGDLSVGEALVRRLQADSSALHQAGLRARNAAWVPRIEAMLDTPGARFVLVGFLHLLGDDGIPALLNKRGLIARQT